MKYIFRNWTTKTIKFVIPLLILTCCTKTVNYENILQKQTKMLSTDVIAQLEKEKVIINDSDFIFVDTTVIEGVHVSNVIISDSIVNNAEKRFIIAHLIRNILIDGAIIYNYDESGNNFTMKPYIEVSPNFIYENRNAICDVIYYLVHKDYFNFYGKPGGGFDKFFSSSLLEVISADLKHLKLKLKKENAFSEAPFAEIDIKQVLASLNTKNKEKYYGHLNFTNEDLLTLKVKGLSGDDVCAYNISAYYKFFKFDANNESIWSEIGAENDFDIAQNDYARILEASNDIITEKKIRSLYWLISASENGNYDAHYKIETENLKLESSYPRLNEDIYKKGNNLLSDYEIKILIDYALRGGKKEAYRLYEYYQDYKKDETEASYWLRIGAQNKDSDCQYEYGKYLLGKDDEYSKIRGGFWIRKAIQNGNTEAKKLLKEIAENEN